MNKETSLEKDFLNPFQEVLNAEYLSDNSILNLLPIGVYVCNMQGLIIKYNDQAVKFWGRKPIDNNSEHFSGAFKLFHPDGRAILHHESPMAACLADGQPRRDLEMVIERPDLTSIHVKANILPILNNEGCQIGMMNSFIDITNEVKTSNDLNSKQKELQDYVDNAAVGLHWVDKNGIIKWANKAELKMLGYSANEFIGHHISEFHADKDKIGDILEKLSLNQELDNYETELLCKDGTIKTVQINSNVYREDGVFIHSRCFTIDISEQKKLFLQLQENEERHRTILKNLHAAIYTCDKNGYITFYNEEAVNLWGRTPEIGKDLWCGSWKIVDASGNDIPLDSCPMARCLSEGRAIFNEEIIVMKPDGEKRFVMPHPKPIINSAGQVTGAVNMLVDITDIKNTEAVLKENEKKYRELADSLEKTIEEKTLSLKIKNEELKKSEERYHKMVDEIEDYAIILLDENGDIQNWNKGAEKIKGYSEAEIIGKNFQEFYFPEDRKSGLPNKLINKARETGKAIHEGWRKRKDGTRFWGSIVLTALHNQQNGIIGFSKVTRDLTERKIAEDKLREYTNQLKFQNEQLEQFAYAASHDMKEPLRKILFYNNHLLETIADSLQEKEREYLNRSINAAKRMEKLINDLLEYSKAVSETQGFEKVDLNELIDETLLSYKDEIEAKGAQVDVQPLPLVMGIPFQIRQVFDNLISNALKYHHPERAPKIRIQTQIEKGNEKVGLENSRDYHKIRFCDNGIGFEPEFSEKIFELFQKLSTVQYQGTGVGLALCKKIAQNHHGTIDATGELNKGACFNLYLPVVQQ